MGQDLPFSEKTFRNLFCTLFTTNTPKVAFLSYLRVPLFHGGPLIIYWAVENRMQPLYVIQVLS